MQVHQTTCTLPDVNRRRLSSTSDAQPTKKKEKAKDGETHSWGARLLYECESGTAAWFAQLHIANAVFKSFSAPLGPMSMQTTTGEAQHLTCR
jgi:hypothetical protein